MVFWGISFRGALNAFAAPLLYHEHRLAGQSLPRLFSIAIIVQFCNGRNWCEDETPFGCTSIIQSLVLNPPKWTSNIVPGDACRPEAPNSIKRYGKMRSQTFDVHPKPDRILERRRVAVFLFVAPRLGNHMGNQSLCMMPLRTRTVACPL